MKTNWPTKKLGEVFSPILEGIEGDILARIKQGDRVEEDHITSTAFTLLEERINGQSLDGLTVRARQFRGRGPNSDESITGADGAVILSAKLKDTEFGKFVLLQAKKFKTSRSKFDGLSIDQKYRMLSFTPDSFFLVYTPKGMYFVSAFLVGANSSISELSTKSFTDFFGDYFDCFIGDRFFVFPPIKFPGPWRYWPLWGEFSGIFKVEEKAPIARRNLFIQVQGKK